MNARSSPRSTIGLPVYNGAALVHISIESVLAQSDPDFELIISDNCSTDDTREICEEYARQDGRVKYERLDRNIGAAGNYNHLVKLAQGEFFRWISHDDRIHADFLAHCVPEAMSDPEIITVAPVLELVNDSGDHVAHVAGYVHDGQWASSRLAQYRQMMDELSYCETHADGFIMAAYEYGLHRLSLLRRTRLVMPFISSDCVLSAELALFGRLRKVDTPLATFALGGGTSSNWTTWNPTAIQRMLDPGRASRLDVALSVRRRHLEHAVAVLRSPLPLREKAVALEAANRPARHRFRNRFARDETRPSVDVDAPSRTA